MIRASSTLNPPGWLDPWVWIRLPTIFPVRGMVGRPCHNERFTLNPPAGLTPVHTNREDTNP